MNQKLADALHDLNFVQTKEKYFVTQVGDYNTICILQSKIGNVVLVFPFYIDSDLKTTVYKELFNIIYKHDRIILNDYGVSLILGGMISNIADRFSKLINSTIDIIRNNNGLGVGYDPISGEAIDEVNSREVDFHGVYLLLNNNTIENFNKSINDIDQKFKSLPNNYAKGFLGAFLGGLCAVTLQVILFILGYISLYTGILGVGLGSFFYTKFGGKRTSASVLIPILTTVVLITLAVIVMYLIAAPIYASELGQSLNGIEAFIYCYTYYEGFAANFMINYVMNLVIAIASGVIMYFALRKKVYKKAKEL